MHNPHCELVLTALANAGFSDRYFKALADQSAYDDLRELLMSILSRENSLPEITAHMNEAVFTVPFSPLPLLASELMRYVNKRNQMLSPDNICRVNKDDSDDFNSGNVFTDMSEQRGRQLVLVSSDYEDGSLEEICNLAERQSKGCFASTHPRLIIDVWRNLGPLMSGLGAHYIAVPKPVAQAAGKFPVMINTNPQGKLMALMDEAPKGSPRGKKYRGYYAFCGHAG